MTMNKEEAAVLLSFHSGRNPDIDHPKWTNGFLGSLRKYDESIQEHNFIEVMECLKVLSEDFKSNTLDRDLMADLFGILYQTTIWIEEGDVSGVPSDKKDRIKTWMKIYSYALTILLDYTDDCYEEAFFAFVDYMNGVSDFE